MDWIAVFDAATERCYYVPSSELGSGRSQLSLRLTPARNGQRTGVRPAKHYEEPALRPDSQIRLLGNDAA